MSDLPSGTVTFLFTDIEGSTKLAREYPEAWETAQARHPDILPAAILWRCRLRVRICRGTEDIDR